MSKAQTYHEWRALATELDRLLGNDTWKKNPKANDYDHRLIASRLDHLRALEAEDDLPARMFFLRAGHLRNLSGIGSPGLYHHAYSGTKALVEEYVREVVQQLHGIASSTDPSISRMEKMAYFSELLQTFGRTVLILHGGASFGLCHLGVVKALHHQGLMPKIFCGSYIGALIAALICVQAPARLREILNGEHIKFEAFFKNGAHSSFRRRLTRLLKYGRLFDIHVLEECARANIGDITFREAYEKTGLVLNITVYAKRKNEVPVLLNYLTAPDLVIWTAACASLATPGIYEEVMLLSKKDDGSTYPWHPSGIKLESARMVQDLPVKRLTELFNANNFIVSQVPSYLTWRPLRSERFRASILGKLTDLFTREIEHRYHQLRDVGLIPEMLLNVISFLKAPMVGDVQVAPLIYFSDIKYIFSSPDPDFVKYCIQKGEIATWRRTTHIEMRCVIEFAIERILDGLRQEEKPLRGDIEALVGMSNSADVAQLYKNVIEEVIKTVRTDFVNMGVDEQLWEQKLIESRVFRPQDFPITASRDYSGSAGFFYPGAPSMRPVYGQSAATMPLTQPFPPIAAYQMAYFPPARAVQPPVQPSSGGRPSNITTNITTQVRSALQPPSEPEALDAAPPLPTNFGQYDGMTDVGPTLCIPPGATIEFDFEMLPPDQRKSQGDSKVAHDTLNQDDRNDASASTLKRESAASATASSNPPAPQAPESSKRSRAEDELGSDLDDEEDDLNGGDDENINDLILCQYEKINRVRTRWRGVLRAGIVHIENADYCFSRANTDFDW